AAAGSHGVFVWDVPTRRRVAVLTPPRDEALEKLLAEIKKRDQPSIAELEAAFEKTGTYYTAPTRLTLSRDGTRLLVSDPTGGFEVWDVATREPLTPVLRNQSGIEKAFPVLSP